jgi:hypothetical protein
LNKRANLDSVGVDAKRATAARPELRTDLADGALFPMYDALIGRALVLTITGKMTPDQAAASDLFAFLNGAAIRLSSTLVASVQGFRGAS